MAPKIQGNVCSELVRPQKKKKASNLGQEKLHPTELKTKLKTLSTKISEVCKNAVTIGCNSTPELGDDMDDLFGSRCDLARDEVLDRDYMKLFDFDNDDHEKRFLKAIEEPVSPLSPHLCNIQFPCAEAPEIVMHTESSLGFSTARENRVPSSSFDVINVEIDSNERTLESLGTAKILSFGTNKSHNDSHKYLSNVGSGDSDIICNSFSSQTTMLLLAPTDKDLTCEYRCPQCCVVSSKNHERSSIYRIFHVCSEIMSQFSGCCSIDRLMENILSALQKADGLSAG